MMAAPAQPLALHVRCPSWATGLLVFQLNGQPLFVEAAPGRFAEVRRTWQAGDRLQVTIPMTLRTESLPGAPGNVAFLYEPLVLAGDLGAVPESPMFPISGDHTVNDHAPGAEVPVLVTNDRAALLAGLHAVHGAPLTFRSEGLGRPRDVTLRPFKSLADNYCNVYWNVVSAADWDQHKATLTAAAERKRAPWMNCTLANSNLRWIHAMISKRSQIGE